MKRSRLETAIAFNRQVETYSKGLPTMAAILGLAVATSFQSPSAAPPAGEVYLYGNQIDPPYTLTIRSDTLFLNAVPINPRLSLGTPPITVDASIQARTEHALALRAHDLNLALRDQHVTQAAIVEGMAALYRAESALVDSVTDVGASTFWVHWRTTKMVEEVIVPCESPQYDRNTQLEDHRAVLQTALDGGGIVIISAKGDLFVSPRSNDHVAFLRREIQRARRAKPDDFPAGRWMSDQLPAFLAAELRSPLSLSDWGR